MSVDLTNEERCCLCVGIKPLTHFHRNSNKHLGGNNCCKTRDLIHERGVRIGLSMSDLQEHARAGSLTDVPGLLLPHLLRALHNPGDDLGAQPYAVLTA